MFLWKFISKVIIRPCFLVSCKLNDSICISLNEFLYTCCFFYKSSTLYGFQLEIVVIDSCVAKHTVLWRSLTSTVNKTVPLSVHGGVFVSEFDTFNKFRPQFIASNSHHTNCHTWDELLSNDIQFIDLTFRVFKKILVHGVDKSLPRADNVL